MKTNTPTTEQLNKQIGQLFSESLKVSNPIQSLHSIREKIQARGYQSFDKEDILNELGQLQHLLGKLHNNLLQIDNILKQA
jgi:nitrate/nitrite-specific signal transduction histidine kinase